MHTLLKYIANVLPVFVAIIPTFWEMKTTTPNGAALSTAAKVFLVLTLATVALNLAFTDVPHSQVDQMQSTLSRIEKSATLLCEENKEDLVMPGRFIPAWRDMKVAHVVGHRFLADTLGTGKTTGCYAVFFYLDHGKHAVLPVGLLQDTHHNHDKLGGGFAFNTVNDDISPESYDTPIEHTRCTAGPRVGIDGHEVAISWHFRPKDIREVVDVADANVRLSARMPDRFQIIALPVEGKWVLPSEDHNMTTLWGTPVPDRHAPKVKDYIAKTEIELKANEDPSAVFRYKVTCRGVHQLMDAEYGSLLPVLLFEAERVP